MSKPKIEQIGSKITRFACAIATEIHRFAENESSEAWKRGFTEGREYERGKILLAVKDCKSLRKMKECLINYTK